MANGVAIHDGNFGADWVNVTIDGKLICQVQYQPDGSQRVTAELVVKALNSSHRGGNGSSVDVAVLNNDGTFVVIGAGGGAGGTSSSFGSGGGGNKK